MWADVKGFEVWEIKGKGDQVKNDVLVDEAMLDRVYARKWVHEASLMDRGTRKAKPVDLPDKSSAPTMLAVLQSAGLPREMDDKEILSWWNHHVVGRLGLGLGERNLRNTVTRFLEPIECPLYSELKSITSTRHTPFLMGRRRRTRRRSRGAV